MTEFNLGDLVMIQGNPSVLSSVMRVVSIEKRAIPGIPAEWVYRCQSFEDFLFDRVGGKFNGSRLELVTGYWTERAGEWRVI